LGHCILNGSDSTILRLYVVQRTFCANGSESRISNPIHVNSRGFGASQGSIIARFGSLNF
jgi:hypothetical protein